MWPVRIVLTIVGLTVFRSFVWSATTVTISHLVLNLRKIAVEEIEAGAGAVGGTPTSIIASDGDESPTMTSSRSLRSQEVPCMQSSWGTDVETGESYELRSQMSNKS